HPRLRRHTASLPVPYTTLFRSGIAPIDRLGELTWLGPLSVLVFGLMVGLVARAASVPRFDLWMLLLTVGTFAGSYPLMYFAQERSEEPTFELQSPCNLVCVLRL